MAKSERRPAARLSFTRSTKRTHVYETLDSKAFTTTLYVKKEHVSDPPPEHIVLTLEEE